MSDDKQLEDFHDMWARFGNGDHLEDSEIDQMIAQAEGALGYIQARGSDFSLFRRQTILDLESLRGYKYWREKDKKK